MFKNSTVLALLVTDLLNAVTFWILNCFVSKIHIKFKRQVERGQIAFSSWWSMVFPRRAAKVGKRDESNLV